jgi:hypothetical protein
MKHTASTTKLPYFKMAGVGLAFSAQLFAAPITVEEAQNVAINWMSSKTGLSFQVKSAPLADAVQAAENPAEAPAYRIVQLEPKGWVIVASDDVARPVLGYGESAVDVTSLPPAFVSWMGGVDKQIKAAVHQAESKSNPQLGAHSSPFLSEWERLKQTPQSNEKLSTQKLGAVYIVPPLLWLGGNDENSGILWSQGEYYNAKAPEDPNSVEDGRALTGCVATAMGQVMRYYGKPTKGTGSFSYDNSRANLQYDPNGFQHDYGVQSANFGATTYDWANMPVSLDATSTPAQVEAVSTLLRHTGVSVGMDYGTGRGDGGSLSLYHSSKGDPAADTAMKKYFGYDAEWKYGGDFTYVEWTDLVKASLDNGNPILYAGSNQAGTGGHAFVLDGYTSDDRYHFNWGWGGQLNGAFSLLGITPSGSDFSYGQQAVFLNGAATGPGGGTTGGGCSYNPHNKGMDMIMMLMVLLAAFYPLGRKYFS